MYKKIKKNKIIVYLPCPLNVRHEIHYNVSFVLIQNLFYVLKYRKKRYLFSSK